MLDSLGTDRSSLMELRHGLADLLSRELRHERRCDCLRWVEDTVEDEVEVVQEEGGALRIGPFLIGGGGEGMECDGQTER